jgi:hypothetical protein
MRQRQPRRIGYLDNLAIGRMANSSLVGRVPVPVDVASSSRKGATIWSSLGRWSDCGPTCADFSLLSVLVPWGFSASQVRQWEC